MRGSSDSNEDALTSVNGFVVPAGQRIDFTGGRDSTVVDDDALRGLFVYGPDTNPEWELRGVEREAGDPGQRSSITFAGADDTSLQVLLGDASRTDLAFDTTGFIVEGALDLPETVNDFRIQVTEAVDNWTARHANLEYNDVVLFRAATEGAAGNDLTVRMLEGTPAVEAVTALGAVASLVDGGTRLVEIDWPEASGADANGRQVQVGAPRNIAGVQATAAIYGETFNDRIGTATWYLPGSAINGIRVGIIGTGLSTQADNTAVGSAVGTLDNIAFINVRVAGTVSYQDIIDAFNAIRVSGTQIITATLDNGVDGTTTFDPAQNLGNDFAGGVDGTADEVSGTAYWSRAVGLLYLASDGTITSAQAVTAINAARNEATASVDTEASNNNIRFTAVQAGEAGNGIQIVISRGSGYTVSVSGRVITVTYPNVASSSSTLIDTINGNTDAAALIRASAIDSTVNFNSNRYVGTFTTVGGADGFDGMAALVAAGVSSTVVPNQTVTAAGGVTAVPAQPRTSLTVRERTVGGNQQLLITGILPNVDTVGILRAAYTDTTKAFEIIALGANQDYVITTGSGANTVLINTNLTGGRDRTTRPTLDGSFISAASRALTQFNLVNVIGASYDASERTTLAELQAYFQQFEDLSQTRFNFDFVQTGNQSSVALFPLEDDFTGGRNYVPPSPIEYLLRGEDEGKFIEVRYHHDHDTFLELDEAALDPERNPDGVLVDLIRGTNVNAFPQEPPFEAPMGIAPRGIGGSSGSSTGGLSEAQVDARVRALVADPAEFDNNSAWPDNKIPSSIARDSEVTSAVDALGTALRGGVAAAGNTLQKLYNLILNRLTQTQVDARIESGVLDEAQAGNTDPFAESKIPTSIARTSAIPEVIDTLGMAVSGTTLTLTASQTGSAADITATIDLESLEEFQGEWANIPQGTAIRAGEFLTHSGRIYYAKVDHNRGLAGPDGDSTNYGVMDSNGGTYDGTAYYPGGTMVSYASGVWWTFANVVPGDPNPDANNNSKWLRLTDNIDAFTGVSKSGAAFTFTRESGANPVTVTEQANGFGLARIGDLYNFTLQEDSASFQDTGIPLPTSPEADSVFLIIARFNGLTGQGTLTGSEMRSLPARALADVTGGREVGSDGSNGNALYAGRLSNGNLALRCDSFFLAGDYAVLYQVGTSPAPAEDDDTPPLPVSRAEAIGITANVTVAARASVRLTRFAATPSVVFGQGNPIIIKERTNNTLTIARGVYTVRFEGNTITNSDRASPVFLINSGGTTISRSDKDYDRAGSNNAFPFSLSANLILDADSELSIFVASDPEQPNVTNSGGGGFTLASSDFTITFIPTGGSETIFYPQEVGLATFNLTGLAQNIALEDASNNDIIAPDTGYIIATFDVPPLGLRGSSQLMRADRLRAARASSDLTSGLFTDANTHQIFYEVAAHEGGATTGNRILIEHVKTTVPTTPTAPVVDPAITEFETTSGNISPPTGSIANDQYGYTLEISQPGHVSSARIIGFAGAGTADKPSSFATLVTVVDYHNESGSLTVPAGTTLANAGDIYTIRLEVYKSGQNPASDNPVAYHDIRIVAHAPATAFYHWGRIAYNSSDSSAADTLARITDFTGDLVTGNTIADAYAATPGNTGEWQFYFFARSDETQPVGWNSSGLAADAAFYDPIAATRGGVNYMVWIMDPIYRRALADGSINYNPRTS